ncbi:MAG: zinc-binding dehydrogenase [Sandaracinus sp.]|nr:zinc-binding dehydrogenase [Sandaracinus sp.]
MLPNWLRIRRGPRPQEAIELGAHVALNSRDKDAIERAAKSFDLLLSTANVPPDWRAYIGSLARRGRLHVLGAVLEPSSVPATSLMMSQRSVSSSPAGSPSDIAKMLDFAGRHGIQPTTEHFGFDRINEAIDHLRSNKARYRVVLDR